MEKPRRYRSLFWPMVLIAVGLVWLLSNLGIVRPTSIGALVAFWPLILIFIGLDVLFGRRSQVIGGLIGLLAVATVVIVLVAGPSLGLPSSAVGTLQTRTITEPVGAATAADINLSFSSEPVQVHPAASAANLLEAKIKYYGSLAYASNGNPTRHITLSSSGNFFFFPFFTTGDASWDIGLNPKVPANLHLDGGSGSQNLDLAELNLTAFFLDQGSGSVDGTLPASTAPYTAEFQQGSGSLSMTLPASANLTLRLTGGSGSINLNLPAGAAVRLEVRSSGSGSVGFPQNLSQTTTSSNSKEGVWQTSGYDQADYKLNIICEDLGSGSFSLN